MIFLSLHSVMTSESSNSLNFATLQQGKIYKELQKKILNGSLETNKYKNKSKNRNRNNKNKNFWIKEGFGESDTIIQDSQQVLSQTEITQSQMLELKNLQKKFSELLKKYQNANDTVISNTKSYISNSDGKNQIENVYVTSVNSAPTATYVGAFKDDVKSSAMMPLKNGQKIYNYDSCMLAAVDSGNKYFGLKNCIYKKR